MSEHKYRIRYTVERGEFTREQLGSDGGTDAVILCSIVRGPEPHEGPVDTGFVSLDGYSGEDIIATEWFRTWNHMAKAILDLDADGLPDWQLKILQRAVDDARTQILARRGR